MGCPESFELFEKNKIQWIINYIKHYFEKIHSIEDFFSGECEWQPDQKRLFFGEKHLDAVFDKPVIDTFRELLNRTAESLDIDFFTHAQHIFNQSFIQIEKNPHWMQFLDEKKVPDHKREILLRHFRYHFIFRLLSGLSNQAGKKQNIAALCFLQNTFSCMKNSYNFAEFTKKMTQFCLLRMKKTKDKDYYFRLLKKKYKSRKISEKMHDMHLHYNALIQQERNKNPDEDKQINTKKSASTLPTKVEDTAKRMETLLAELTSRLPEKVDPDDPMRKKSRSNSLRSLSIFEPYKEKNPEEKQLHKHSPGR